MSHIFKFEIWLLPWQEGSEHLWTFNTWHQMVPKKVTRRIRHLHWPLKSVMMTFKQDDLTRILQTCSSSWTQSKRLKRIVTVSFCQKYINCVGWSNHYILLADNICRFLAKKHFVENCQSHLMTDQAKKYFTLWKLLKHNWSLKLGRIYQFYTFKKSLVIRIW